MGKGRPRAVEKGVLGGGQGSSVIAPGSLNIPPAPVFHPSEEEFKDPLEYIYKIRPQAEPYGICRIVPPSSWKPPFALDMDSFTFPTKTQAIHQLQARPASCDSETFELEYNRFLEDHGGKKLKKRVVFEGEELDLCKLFNAAKRFGGYDKVLKDKKWGEVFRFVRPSTKISECAKHVLCQLYREHLYDYETYYSKLNQEVCRSSKRGMYGEMKSDQGVETSSSKRRRRNNYAEKVDVCKAENNKELDQMCEQCRSGLHGEVMLLCDRCNRGWHIYCLSPPLKQIPPGNWYCFDCLNSNKDSFGFVPGKHFSLEAFRRMADRAKKKWFGPGPISQMQIEKKFWEIVEGSVGEVEVLYGSDLDTSIYGSGFPRTNHQKPESVDAKVWDEYCSSPWNLNNLPKLEGSVLRAVHQSIAGVMVPWLYIGMLFSSFCWHFEDHCFYSMNYLHWGDPKCWYSIPGSKAGAFEKVMRNSLPDLFDAQPDLLFQLVTMLNPSVLQENKVPVYNVMQEPGNFVVTFPRSYHGGFNFGLNCAEAVNFAPADWLPHGGFGAELYQLYRKAAVLSHEELLCVVAKKDCGSKVSPYLKKELLRIYTKEKTWREKLWKNGLVKSSPMPSRKCPEYVGTEEDPTCIICQQYLYLSAVVCRCRPSTFVCLEDYIRHNLVMEYKPSLQSKLFLHWEHLCECKHHKRRLLYRHTLAELNDLVLSIDKYSIEEVPQSGKIQRQIPCSKETFALTKKVKGGHASLAQLAERWLLHSCKIFQSPFCSEDYSTALKKAEQFLWAGPEVDAVRETAKNLDKAKKWAEGIKKCLSKVENWLCHCGQDEEKLDFEYLDKLLSLSPAPCDVPGLLKLKDYAEEARLIVQEIHYTLTTHPKISDLESLYSKACRIPIHVKQNEKLAQKITSTKVWIESVNKCIHEKHPAAVEVETLYRLKSEALELQVQLPETERLIDLLSQVESCQTRCIDLLRSPINLKAVEVLLEELQDFTVSFPELQRLRQHYIDALSWISRFNSVLVNIHQRQDHGSVVEELNCILKDGTSLRIHVDELPLVEVELGKARCREKAHKARATRVALDFIKQLNIEAEVLHIGGEEIFSHMSQVVEIATNWEERATYILTNEAQMSDFEDVLRASENISVILPSLHDVVDAISVANSWLKNSEPFLLPAFSTGTGEAIGSLLKVNVLKELVAQSKLLKISLKEREMLESVLAKCDAWQRDAYSVLQDVDCLLNMHNINDGMSNEFISKIGFLSTNIKSIIEAGLSIGFDFDEIPKLHNASSMLQWCDKALSFSSTAPSFEEAQSLAETAESLPISAGAVLATLTDGVKWLKKAAEILVPSYSRGCKLSDAEEVLAAYECIEVSFPIMHVRLTQAIQKQKLWEEQVHQFFSQKSGDHSAFPLLKLMEIEKGAIFGCSELDMILSKAEKVEKWKQRCEGIIEIASGDVNPLLSALLKINQTLTRSLHIYNKLSSKEVGKSSICCSSDTVDPKILTCSTCNECYHLGCLGLTLSQIEHVETYSCLYCQWLENGSIPRNGSSPLRSGRKRPELKMLIKLFSDAEALPLWIEEKDMLQQLVGQAIACKARLTEILDFTMAYIDKDLNVVRDKLITAIKAVEVAGIYDHQGMRDLELALTRNSWKLRANKLLENKEKPTIQQIQRHLKEGLAMNIPIEDHFRQILAELKRSGMRWADFARKVSTDAGALGLSEVFDLIAEGEKLPIALEKELKLLRARSMLYCICRKPYDQRAMIACDECEEWYHFDCIKIVSTPKYYVCPACKPSMELESSAPSLDEVTNTKVMELKGVAESRRKAEKVELQKTSTNSDESNNIYDDEYHHPSGINRLWWRNRKPFRREAKKRAGLDCLSPFVHIQQQ